MDAVHSLRIACLAERGDPSVAYTDVSLDHAPVVEDDRTGDHEVRRAFGAGRTGLAHRFPNRLSAAEHSLVTTDAPILSDLDEQIGVREADSVTRGGTEGSVVLSTSDLTHRGFLRTLHASRQLCVVHGLE